MTLTITEFIAARLDEEQALAESAIDVLSGEWVAEGGSSFDDDITVRTAETRDRIDVVLAGRDGGGGVVDRPTADHIAAQDPARTLRRVAALRRMAAWHPPTDRNGTQECDGCAEDCHSRSGLACPVPVCQPWPCDDLRALAEIWSDHPDYRPEWSLT